MIQKDKHGLYTVWLLVHGSFKDRQELACELTREAAESLRIKLGKPYIRVDRTYVLKINGVWRRVLASPVQCKVPIVEKELTRKVRRYTWRQRMRILLTGQLSW